jgi:Tfp pilus assembly protein PilF
MGDLTSLLSLNRADFKESSENTMSHSTFRLLTFVIVLTLAACPALAQRGSGLVIPVEVHGQVRHANGGAPAENVLVRIERFGGGIVEQVMTDRTGKFRFTGLAQAQYLVTAHAAGFKDAQQQVDLQTATSDYVLFQLMPDDSARRASPAGPAKLIRANVPTEAQREFEKGQAASHDAKIEEGIRHLEKAVSIYPNFLEAQLMLGTIYMDLGQWNKAEQMLSRTLEINPKTANALFALGEIYLRQKKHVEAEKVLLQGLQIEDRSYQGHLTLGRVYWDMASKIKDETGARPLLERSYDQVKVALKMNPDLAAAHLLKGNLLLRAGRPQEALNEFQEYLRIAPNGQFADQTRAIVDKIKKALASK